MTDATRATVHVVARVVEDYGADLMVEFTNPNGKVRICVGRNQLALDYLPPCHPIEIQSAPHVG